MIPRLPNNLNTISPISSQASTWTPEYLHRRYGDRPRLKNIIEQIDQDLATLRAWDTYDRKTCDNREELKIILTNYRTKWN